MQKEMFRIELHAHTNPVSHCSEVTPADTVRAYSELGFNGIAITNHFNMKTLIGGTNKEKLDYYLKDFYEAKAEGDKLGLQVYLGMEIRFPQNANEFLVFGIDEGDVEKYIDYVDKDYTTFYRECKNARNLILQAHPFRKKITREDPELLDGMEVWNLHPHHNSNIAKAIQYAEQFPHFIKTAGTDFHHPGHEGLAYIQTKHLPQNSFELAQLLKSNDFVNCIWGHQLIKWY